MAGLGGIFGKGSIGEQLFVWGLLSQVVQSLTNPGINELAFLVNSATQVNPLSPAELAQLVNRGFTSRGAGAADAAKAGINGDRFDHLVQLAGEAPGPAELTEALRRGIIAENGSVNGLPSFVDGIRQGNLRNVWAPFYKALAVQLPSWSDALDALLEGQLPRGEALDWYTRAGGDPAAFQWLFDTRGTSPTPDMLGTLANRGLIPWEGTGPNAVTFAQGFLEGPWRNKWQTAMRGLAEYHPPPRTVTALLRSGAIDQATALDLFRKEGLSPEIAAAMVKDASAHHTTAAKALSRSDIETMLTEHLISADDAKRMLAALGYTAANANLLVTQVDVKRAMANTNNAVTRIRTLLIGHRLGKADAAAALHKLGLTSGQSAELIATWEIAEAANVRALTPAQVVAAWGHQIMTQAEAEAELVGMGYTKYDAWVLLSIHNKKPLPDRPAKT